MRHSLAQHEAPIASHLLYTQPGVLRDAVPAERQWGIDAGLAWREVADATVVYIDRGISQGMRYGIAAAHKAGVMVEYRAIKDSEACATLNASEISVNATGGITSARDCYLGELLPASFDRCDESEQRA